MEREAELKNTALQEARHKLTEALSRLEVVVHGLPVLTTQENFKNAAPPPAIDEIEGTRLDRFKRHDV
jgi:hypothetical protein